MERGFSNVSMETIADAAGVAKATLYARFGDKEGLLQASIEAKCLTFLDDEALDPPVGKSLRECLIHLAHRFVALVTSQASVSMHRLFLTEHDRAPHLPELFFRTAILPTKARVVLYLEREAARGRLDLGDDAEGAAMRFLGMVKGLSDVRAMLNLPPQPQQEIDRHIEGSVDMFLKAYGV
jgi:TetR/AcrR family transcriptional repressor of mexJK operon